MEQESDSESDHDDISSHEETEGSYAAVNFFPVTLSVSDGQDEGFADGQELLTDETMIVVEPLPGTPTIASRTPSSAGSAGSRLTDSITSAARFSLGASGSTELDNLLLWTPPLYGGIIRSASSSPANSQASTSNVDWIRSQPLDVLSTVAILELLNAWRLSSLTDKFRENEITGEILSLCDQSSVEAFRASLEEVNVTTENAMHMRILHKKISTLWPKPSNTPQPISTPHPLPQRSGSFASPYSCLKSAIFLDDVPAHTVNNRILKGSFINHRSEWEECAVKRSCSKQRDQDLAREIAILRELATATNPSAVKIFHTDTTNTGELYFVMERFPYDLSNALKSHCETLFCKMVVPRLIDCVVSLHQTGFMHGDIKPQNFLYSFVDNAVTVKLCDFDSAARIGSEQFIHGDGGFKYTASYVCPELLPGHEYSATPGRLVASELPDFFSLGLVIWQILTSSHSSPLACLSDAGKIQLIKSKEWFDRLRNVQHCHLLAALLVKLCSFCPTDRMVDNDSLDKANEMVTNLHAKLAEAKALAATLQTEIKNVLEAIDHDIHCVGDKVDKTMEEVAEFSFKVCNILEAQMAGTYDLPTLAVLVPETSNGWNPLSLVRIKYRLRFVCAHRLCIVKCGPDGHGYPVSINQEWVKRAAPVLRISLMVLQVAAAAAGIPIPIAGVLSNVIADIAASDAFVQIAFDRLKEADGIDIRLNSFGSDIHRVSIENEGSRAAYLAVKEVIDKQDPSYQFLGVRRVTDFGKPQWISNDADTLRSYTVNRGARVPDAFPGVAKVAPTSDSSANQPLSTQVPNAAVPQPLSQAPSTSTTSSSPTHTSSSSSQPQSPSQLPTAPSISSTAVLLEASPNSVTGPMDSQAPHATVPQPLPQAPSTSTTSSSPTHTSSSSSQPQSPPQNPVNGTAEAQPSACCSNCNCIIV
jgi:serine/threonine protein kinase